MTDNTSLTDATYWNRYWSGSGTRIISEHDPQFGRDGEFMRLIRRHIQPLDDLSVVELGGAMSYRALALAKWCNARVTLSDYSSVGMRRTEEVFAANGCTAETLLGDFLSWNPDGRVFDLVLHFGVLEHFGNIEALMSVCAKLLAAEGTVFFTMPDMRALGAWFWKHWSPANWGTHIYHSDEQVCSSCAAVGLEVVRTFHAGSPLLQIARWERPGPVAPAISLAQRIVDRFGRSVPVYDRGLRRVSCHRGFVAQHATTRRLTRLGARSTR